MACGRCFEKYERKLGSLFERYGHFITSYPVIILTLSILINCGLGIGLVWIKSETSSEVLYTPRNSEASKDRNRIKSLFEDKSNENFYSKSTTDTPLYSDIIIASKNGSNILTSTFISNIEKIHKDIIANIMVRNDSRYIFRYNNVCAQRDNDCVVDGSIIFTPEFKSELGTRNIPYPAMNGSLFNLVFGNKTVKNNKLKEATMVRLIYYLRSTPSSMSELSTKWEKEFLNYMPSLLSKSTEFDIYYSVSSSLDSELNDNTAGDIIYFSLTFTLMITYASVATAGGKCVSNRQNLGLAGVLAAVLAILASFGFVSAIGIDFVNIVGVMPFLIIGIGIDDMFILMSGFSDSPLSEDISSKIGHTMKTSGIAITITSLTNFLAFAIGASSVFMSVRNFCIYTGVAVFFCYLNQLTFFLPCMVINERRVQGQRHFGTCMLITSRKKLKDSNNPKKEKKCYLYCCTGDPPVYKGDNESPLEKYPKIILKKLVMKIPSKIVIILMYAGYLGASIWGVINLEQGLLLSNLVSSDSYFHAYSEKYNAYFDNSIMVTFIIDSRQKYFNSETQEKIHGLLNKAGGDPDVDGSLTVNWLDDYNNSSWYTDTDEYSFIAGLKQFLSRHTDYKNDIRLSSDGQAIDSSRFYVLTKHLKTSTDQGNLMKRMREIADTSGLPCFAYAPAFIFYEQYVTILFSTLQTVGIGVAVMFVITCIFMPQPVLVLLVLITMVMILLGIFGFMHYWDLTLSSVTMIHLIMSVGFSVDFSTHICHAFISGEEIDRESQVKGAFDRAGGPIFNSAMSSFVGIVMLTASSSYIFLSFFKLMLLVILFGLAHAIFLLPVVLSFIGPMNNKTVRSQSAEPGCSRNRISPSPEVNEENAKSLKNEASVSEYTFYDGKNTWTKII